MIVGSPFRTMEMLKLGMMQLAASEKILLELIGTSGDAWKIAQECAFVLKTLDAVEEMAQEQSLVVAGSVLRVGKRMRALIEKADEVVNEKGSQEGPPQHHH